MAQPRVHRSQPQLRKYEGTSYRNQAQYVRPYWVQTSPPDACIGDPQLQLGLRVT